MINVVSAQLTKGFAVGRVGVTRLGHVPFDLDMVLDKIGLLVYSHTLYLNYLRQLIVSVSDVIMFLYHCAKNCKSMNESDFF